MKKTNEEFKAEVFRRRDEYMRKKKARRNLALSICVPFALCFSVYAAMIIPAMMPASSADREENNYIVIAAGYGYDISGLTKDQMLFPNERVTKMSIKSFVSDAESSDTKKDSLAKEESNLVISCLSSVCAKAEQTPKAEMEVFDGAPVYIIEAFSDYASLGMIRIYTDRILVNDIYYEISSEEFSQISDLIFNVTYN